MKKSLKKLISAVMAVSCMASMSLFSTSALYHEVDINNLPDYMKDSEIVYSSYEPNSFSVAFHIYHDDKTGHYHALEVLPDYIRITAPTEFDEDMNAIVNEDIKAVIRSYIPEGLEIYTYETAHDGILEMGYTVRVSENPEILDSVREMKQALSEVAEISSFTFDKGAACLNLGYIMSESGNITDYLGVSDEKVEEVKKYVEDNNLDFTVNSYKNGNTYRCYVEPNSDMSIQEQFLVAEKLKENVGLGMPFVRQVSFGTIDNGDNVDILNGIDGDANCDGEMNIADATAIVQAIGNPDRYALSAQGNFNADSDGNGLTGLDALAIQIKLINKN